MSMLSPLGKIAPNRDDKVLTRFGSISIIDNQTNGLVLDRALLPYLLYQTKVHCIEQLAPSDITIVFF